MTDSEKNQVNLPKAVQEAVGIKPGVAVKWVVTNAGALLTRDEPSVRGADIVRKLRGKGNGRFTTASLLKQTRG